MFRHALVVEIYLQQERKNNLLRFNKNEQKTRKHHVQDKTNQAEGNDTVTALLLIGQRTPRVLCGWCYA